MDVCRGSRQVISHAWLSRKCIVPALANLLFDYRGFGVRGSRCLHRKIQCQARLSYAVRATHFYSNLRAATSPHYNITMIYYARWWTAKLVQQRYR